MCWLIIKKNCFVRVKIDLDIILSEITFVHGVVKRWVAYFLNCPNMSDKIKNYIVLSSTYNELQSNQQREQCHPRDTTLSIKQARNWHLYKQNYLLMLFRKCKGFYLCTDLLSLSFDKSHISEFLKPQLYERNIKTIVFDVEYRGPYQSVRNRFWHSTSLWLC